MAIWCEPSARRGRILVGALLSTDIRPGGAACAEGAWFDPAKPGRVGAICKNSNVNTLTFDGALPATAQGNCGHMAQLQIEKYIGQNSSTRPARCRPTAKQVVTQ